MKNTLNSNVQGIDMRDAFFDELYDIAKEDPNVIFITADMGAHSLARFKHKLPNQYINVGVAEQNMVSVAAGLALGGKRVFIYTIIPFMTMRCYEQVKIDLCCMDLPVTLIGVGSGFTYGSDGPTHHATGDIAAIRIFPEMTILNPSDAVATAAFVHLAYKNLHPTYVRIDKGFLPIIYDKEDYDFSEGLSVLRNGVDLVIFATGFMVQRTLGVANELSNYSLSAGVVDLYRIKPLNKDMLLEIIDDYRFVVTLEENNITGGVGSAISEVLHDNQRNSVLKRIAIPDEHCFECGNRDVLHKFYNLDTASVTKDILQWLKHS